MSSVPRDWVKRQKDARNTGPRASRYWKNKGTGKKTSRSGR